MKRTSGSVLGILQSGAPSLSLDRLLSFNITFVKPEILKAYGWVEVNIRRIKVLTRSVLRLETQTYSSLLLGYSNNLADSLCSYKGKEKSIFIIVFDMSEKFLLWNVYLPCRASDAAICISLRSLRKGGGEVGGRWMCSGNLETWRFSVLCYQNTSRRDSYDRTLCLPPLFLLHGWEHFDDIIGCSSILHVENLWNACWLTHPVSTIVCK